MLVRRIQNGLPIIFRKHFFKDLMFVSLQIFRKSLGTIFIGSSKLYNSCKYFICIFQAFFWSLTAGHGLAYGCDFCKTFSNDFILVFRMNHGGCGGHKNMVNNNDWTYEFKLCTFPSCPLQKSRFSLSQLKTNQRGLSHGVSQSSYCCLYVHKIYKCSGVKCGSLPELILLL